MSAVVGHVPVKLIGVLGRATRQRRYIPLVNLPGEDGTSYSVNSYGGMGVPPQWFKNLEYNPDDVEVRDTEGRVRCRARFLRDDQGREYIDAWQKLIRAYPPLEDYARQALKFDRKLIIVCFEPCSKLAGEPFPHPRPHP